MIHLCYHLCYILVSYLFWLNLKLILKIRSCTLFISDAVHNHANLLLLHKREGTQIWEYPKLTSQLQWHFMSRNTWSPFTLSGKKGSLNCATIATASPIAHSANNFFHILHLKDLLFAPFALDGTVTIYAHLQVHSNK